MIEKWRKNKFNEQLQRINDFMKDMRNKRQYPPTDGHDILVERDACFSIRSSIVNKQLALVKYWGIILPEDVGFINLEKYLTHCPTCVDGVYTNIWTQDSELYGTNYWGNLFILSPNYRYPSPFCNLIDCII